MVEIELELDKLEYCVDDVIRGCLTLGSGRGQRGLVVQLVVRVPWNRASMWRYEVLEDTIPIEKGGGRCKFELHVPHCNELAELLPPDKAAEIDYSICVVDGNRGNQFEKASILLFRRIHVTPKYSEDEIRELVELDYKVDCVTMTQLKKWLRVGGDLYIRSTECLALLSLERSYLSLLLTYFSDKRLPPKTAEVSYKTQLQYKSPSQGGAIRDIAEDCLGGFNIEWINKDHTYCALLPIPITMPESFVPSFSYRSTSYQYTVRITLNTDQGIVRHNAPIVALTST